MLIFIFWILLGKIIDIWNIWSLILMLQVSLKKILCIGDCDLLSSCDFQMMYQDIISDILLHWLITKASKGSGKRRVLHFLKGIYCICSTEISNLGRAAGKFSRGILEAFLEPCRLLLLGGSLNTFKQAINKNFDISWWEPLDSEALRHTVPSAPPSRRPWS